MQRVKTFGGTPNGERQIRAGSTPTTVRVVATAHGPVGLVHLGDEARANARLIAEAPAMADALSNIVGEGAQMHDYCDRAEHDADSQCIWCEARAILARIDGEERQRS